MLLVAIVLTAVVRIQPALAQGAGDLIVAPTRVVLEGRTRSAQLTLSNTGANTSTYRISIVNLRMNDDGSVTEITDPAEGQKFADGLFRYSPRQITLAPAESQTVRILLRKPKDLADGEYRSHIFFRAVPDEAGQSINQTATGDGLQIRLIPIYGITLPIVIRHGKTDVTASLSELKISPPDENNPLPTLGFRISRGGNASAFGDFTATHISGSGEKTIIGEVQRLAVYTPNKSRTVKISLRVPESLTLSSGEIHLAFRATEDDGRKMLAETTLKLP
ncbi:MAG: fimbria/pilus periplasmic chaperone [Rhodospirillales bacterium]|nr:fimbria/pilus periplasmic chaperone [Rhodospirillales bacterium]